MDKNFLSVVSARLRSSLSRAGWGTVFVLAFAFASLLGLLEITRPAVWDPVELEIAEAARHSSDGDAANATAATRSIALFFRVLGVRAWTGRLPMLAWGVLGVLAGAWFAAKFFGKRAAAFVVLVLATSPLYFAHERAMTGAIVAMACIATTFAGFAFAAFSEASQLKRGLSFVVAIFFALVAARSCGALVAVAVPALAVGLAFAFSKSRATDSIFGAFALVIGALVSALALLAVSVHVATLESWALGAQHLPEKTPSFDAPLSALVYALFPWSALLPLCFSLLARTTPRFVQVQSRVAIVLASALAIAAHAALAPRTGVTPFVGAGLVAIAIAVALDEFEIDATDALAPARRMAMFATALVIVWLVIDDVSRNPEKIAAPYALAKSIEARAFPATVATNSTPTTRMRIVGAVLVAPLALAFLLDEALLVRLRLGAFARGLARHRVLVVGAAAVAAGLVFRIGVLSPFLAHVAPESALDAYGKLHAPGEPLALLGVSDHTLAYVNDPPREATVATTARQAVDTLVASHQGRSWLAIDARELPQVNARYREIRGKNAPILAGGGDNVLLVASDLKPAEENENPLDDFVRDTRPSLARPLNASIGETFDVFGWDVVNDDGKPLTHVSARSTVHVRLGLSVKDKVPGGYCTFLHIDATPSRVAVEHREFSSYPMSLWRKGDVIVDDFAVHLPQQLRKGRYQVYFGIGNLPCDDDRRMPVTSGRQDGHQRIAGGELEVN